MLHKGVLVIGLACHGLKAWGLPTPLHGAPPPLPITEAGGGRTARGGGRWGVTAVKAKVQNRKRYLLVSQRYWMSQPLSTLGRLILYHSLFCC